MKKYMVIDEYANDHTLARANVFEADSSEQALSKDAYMSFMMASNKKSLACIGIYELKSGVNELTDLVKGDNEK